MSERTPNSEQLLAIEHEGGVLLRAGAGSGKTFVLVEHIVWLTRKWMSDWKKSPKGTFEEFIREKYSQVVMMTFTKKAAGEMSIRLSDRIQKISQAAEDEIALWSTANESIPLLTVTTIDGFCRKLITQGYFQNLSTEADIIFETERIDQVKELLDLWFEERGSKVSREVADIIIRQKDDLLNAFSKVFNDPGLRLQWKNFSLSDSHPEKVPELLKKSFKLHKLDEALFKIHSLDLPSDKLSAFEKFAQKLQATGLPEVDTVDKLTIYSQLFIEKGILKGESTEAKKDEAHKIAHDGMKSLRDWTENWYEVVRDFNENYDSRILPWIQVCRELFFYIDEHLDPNLGLTFGDIAYLVAQGLEEKAVRDRVQKAYTYFIVDEFQDTSALQFRIIKGLIGDDFSRLFCVGDAKQAIYGFRGGELSVFQDCGELVPVTRSLANNYRSQPGVIHFNNSLFQTILPLGQDFIGKDHFGVAPEDQKVPDDVMAKGPGRVEILELGLEWNKEEEDKFSNEKINRLESQIIAEAIRKDRIDRPAETVTILFSKLKPSAELIRALMDRKIGFTAQFKTDLLDDPVMGMFLCLLKRQFDTNPKTVSRYPLFLMESYFNVMGIRRDSLEPLLQNFDRDISYWGLLPAFRKFIHSLAITNENSDINMDVIETLSEIYHQDPESILIQIGGGDNERVSLDLRSGENSHLVQIMSAHASKGLEFETVYLGGIYTNGRDQSSGSFFGNMPGSFSWYLDLSLRDKRKSPFFVYEKEISEYKNFSETKRLFYVATTRAMNKISWVKLNMDEKAFSIPGDSWINGLYAWEEEGEKTHCNEKVTYHKVTDLDVDSILKGKSQPKLPLFFHDPVGILDKGLGETELSIMGELSVTRLNSLVDCPRKFYFENVLKLTAGKTRFFDVDNEVESEEPVFRSSASRGTLIHEILSTAIQRNFVIPREHHNGPYMKPLQWALGTMESFRNDFNFVSEKPLKFKLFNFMISGIPDLLLLSKSGNQSAQIWDFKTGKITQDNLGHYWVQLKAYAYALYVLGLIPREISIETKLCFVDEQKFVNLTVDWSLVGKDLFEVWRSQNEPWKTKTDHCSQCAYGDICPR